MICKIILLILTCITVGSEVFAKNNKVHRIIYLIGTDHGILNQKGIGQKIQKLTLNKIKPVLGQTVWQCFPREKVKISLIDQGYSSEDLAWQQNHSNLVITIHDKKNLKHEYTMRRYFDLSDYENRFHMWLTLMKNQSFVCLAGEYIEREQIKNKYQNYLQISWLFDGIKTLQGHNCYFQNVVGCNYGATP